MSTHAQMKLEKSYLNDKRTLNQEMFLKLLYTDCHGFSFMKAAPCGTAECNLATNNATFTFVTQHGSHYFERQ